MRSKPARYRPRTTRGCAFSTIMPLLWTADISFLPDCETDARERCAMRQHAAHAAGCFSSSPVSASRARLERVSPRARLTILCPRSPTKPTNNQALAVQQTALGAASPGSRASQSRDRRARASLAAAGAAGALGSHPASPCVASVAPPPKSAPPIVRHTRWTETEVFAPTKCGKLRRRKGGGGDENRDPRGSAGSGDGGGPRSGSDDGAFGPGEPADARVDARAG